MTDRHDYPPALPYRHAVVLRAALRVEPANDAYHLRLNGVPHGSLPPSRWYPLPVLDPDVSVELRRAALEVLDLVPDVSPDPGDELPSP